MVMETPPSPQCVGREFVRQYYTLLNKAPAYLHRFYNNSSSFIHGGLDPPNRETTLVVGQKQIHQKIQQLNFRDCHAKITQVDSQATLGNGVVVQVTGELSNGGQPMRRFTQTFVLAFQAPKKYYVHNDIFRYQDMLTEEEYEEVSRTNVDEDLSVIQQQNNNHNNNTSNNNSTQVEEERDDWSSQPMVNGTSESHHHELAAPTEQPSPAQPIHRSTQPSHHQTQQTQPPSQPIHPANPVTPQPAQPVPAAVQPVPAQPQPQPPLTPQLDSTPLQTDTSTQDSTPTTHVQHSSIEPEEDSYNQNELEPPLPASPLNNSGDSILGEVVKTYANLVKGSSGNVTTPTTMYHTSPQLQNQSQIHPQPASPTGGAGRVDRPKPRESRVFVRSDENFTPPTTNNTEPASNFEMDRGRKTYYNDNQQLFMGNLPHYATESSLKEVFGRFGNIIEMRILSKNTGKGSSGKVPPNYGFVIFEQPSSVQAVLNAKHPIMYPDESGTRLNVEEKKTKGSGGGIGGGGGGRGGSRVGGGGRGGGSMSRDGGARTASRPGGPPSSAPLPQRHNYRR